MRARKPCRRRQLIAVLWIVGLATVQADADVIYQVTDLGKSYSSYDSSASVSADYGERRVRPVRIDDDGQANVYESRSLDRSNFGTIQAPYTVGGAELYRFPQDTHYQVGYAISNDNRSIWQAVIWDGHGGHVLGPQPPPPGS